MTSWIGNTAQRSSILKINLFEGYTTEKWHIKRKPTLVLYLSSVVFPIQSPVLH